MHEKARSIDHEVWALKHARGLSLNEARQAVSKTPGLHVDHIRRLQRLALEIYLDDIVEAQLEDKLMGL